MFCRRKNDDSTLSCDIKWVSEIISFISIIFSVVVVYVVSRYTKLNVVNKLVLQILISEIIDGFNILLVIFDDYQYPRTFENYYTRRGICFSQIFLSLFVCLWTLISTFFISLRIYDITVRKNTLFKKRIMKNIHIFSIFIPLFVSFWFWIGQTSYQAKELNDVPWDSYYFQKRVHNHFRHMYCWYEKNINYVIFAICVILIVAEFFFSVNGIIVMKNIKTKLTDDFDPEGSFSINKKKAEVESIIKTLWIYPITSAILWLLFFILQILFDNNFHQHLSWIYCILISIRQPIYTLVLLFTQKKIKKEFINSITCRRKKKDKSVIYKLNPDDSIITNS